MAPALAADVTNTAGDTSPGSLRAAAATGEQLIEFTNLGASATINLADSVHFTSAGATLWRYIGSTTSLTVGGGDVLVDSHLYLDAGAGGDLTLNSDVIFTTSADILSVQGGGTVTFNGDISDAGRLWIVGGSTAVLGTTTFSDLIDMSGNSTVRFATDGTYSSAIEIENTATIDTDAHDVTVTGDISDDGTNTLVKTGSGTLTLSGNATYSGGTSVNAGTLSIANDGNLGSGTLTLNGGDLAVTGATTIDNGISLASNATLANSTDVTLSGVISGAGNLTKSGAGTLTLTGTNTYSGGTTVSGGTLQVGDGGTTGSINGNIVNNAALIFNRSDALAYGGEISGTGSLTKSGAGTLTLTGANSFSGGMTVSAGSVTLGAAERLSDAGSVTVNAGATFNLNDFNERLGDLSGAGAVVLGTGNLTAGTTAGSTFSGVISGDGAFTKQGSGTLILTGTNTYSGGTTISAGTLQVGDGGTTGSLAGNVVNNSALAFNRSDALSYSGEISGTGSLTKSGAGTLTLTGTNTYSGGTTVSGGLLTVNGSTGDITLNGGTLGGSGTVGTVTVNSGGAVAPGNSIGTLNVSGNTSFASGSTYDVEVDKDGNSDKIVATGTATIDSGATVSVSAENGTDDGSTYAPFTSYTILTADTGVTGTFGSVADSFAFLDASLSYDANNVYLKLMRNTFTFASLAKTANQRASAGALDTLGSGNAVYDAVSVLNEADARAAFNSLSGEVHASVNTLLIQESSFARNAASDRIRGAFESVGSGDMPMIAFNGPGETPDADGGVVAWGQAYGSWGRNSGNGNAATMDHAGGGFFMGLDTEIFGGWRAGLMAGYGNTSFDVDARGSSGDADSYTLGAYAGRQSGPLGVRLGASFALHDVGTSRNVTAGTLTNALGADYTAATAQLFGEAGYTHDSRVARLEPFAGFALIHQSNDAFTETGGAAALSVDAASLTLGVTTLGLRAERQVAAGDHFTAALSGSLGWSHAIGDLDAASTMRFAAGDAFKITGTPLDRDTALIEAGVKLGFGEDGTLSAHYNGDFGAKNQAHGFNARLSARF